MRRLSVLLVLLSLTALASADVPQDVRERIPVSKGRFITMPYNGPVAAQTSGYIYMNRCTGGCTISNGADDARAMSSSIVAPGTHVVTEFQNDAGQTGAAADDAWHALLTCVQEVYSPFAVTVSDRSTRRTESRRMRSQGVLQDSPSRQQVLSRPLSRCRRRFAVPCHACGGIDDVRCGPRHRDLEIDDLGPLRIGHARQRVLDAELEARGTIRIGAFGLRDDRHREAVDHLDQRIAVKIGELPRRAVGPDAERHEPVGVVGVDECVRPADIHGVERALGQLVEAALVVVLC